MPPKRKRGVEISLDDLQSKPKPQTQQSTRQVTYQQKQPQQKEQYVLESDFAAFEENKADQRAKKQSNPKVQKEDFQQKSAYQAKQDKQAQRTVTDTNPPAQKEKGKP